jgi:transposase-like protein
MGMSHRRFTREFKLAAVRRLEEGIPIAELARGLEVNPNVLHRWRREFRGGPGYSATVSPSSACSKGARSEPTASKPVP